MSSLKSYSPKRHLDNYISLIGDEKAFNYAVLELRFAIEAIVYKQIESYGNKVPQQVIETWQPNKSFKLLCSFDEKANKSLDISWAKGDGSEDPKTLSYKSIGNQRVFKISELNKMYNTLGNFLHLPSLKSVNTLNYGKNAKVIEKIYTNLSDIVSNGNIYIRGSFVEAKCPYCEKMTILPNSILNEKSPQHYKCTNQNCCKLLLGSFHCGNIKLQKVGVQVQCQKCNHTTFIDDSSINSVLSAVELDIQCDGQDCDQRITFRPVNIA
ncbi:hypothetical protein [Pseudoalteromonas sp. S1608]|uniref:hypothetical protein n=1 Tax=Pseudoalteromonas sp. S1608 TaxID=579504 RepID=UPI00110BE36D|nr:hypothetical protein [Pseudoalteromonas sp. S1608]TMP72552.1 hypothetical protein CWB75_16255 [Pseudoalteromonas sp. S1608]